MKEQIVIIKEYPETHRQGSISFEQDIKAGTIKGDFGLQIARDGRVWICIDGQALIRFKPLEKEPQKKRSAPMNVTRYERLLRRQ